MPIGTPHRPGGHVLGGHANVTRWMQGIEGEREQAERSSVQSCVVCKSRIHALSTHAMSSLRVPALSLLSAVSSNVKEDVGMGYVSLSLHLVWMLFGMPSLHPFTLFVWFFVQAYLSVYMWVSKHSICQGKCWTISGSQQWTINDFNANWQKYLQIYSRVRW